MMGITEAHKQAEREAQDKQGAFASPVGWAITPYLAAMERAGFVIAPIEATVEMRKKARKSVHRWNKENCADGEVATSEMQPAIHYSAMISARPRVQS